MIDTVGNLSEKSLNEVHEDRGRIFDDDSMLARHCIEDDMKYLQIYHHLQCHWNKIRKIKSTGTLCDLLSVSSSFSIVLKQCLNASSQLIKKNSS